jgi:hypothetical protein
VTLESPSVDNTLIACQQGEIWIDDATLRQGRSVLEIGTQCEVRARRALFTGAAQHAVIVQSGGVLGIEDSTLTGSSGAILVEGTVNVDRSYVDNHYGLGGIDVQSGSLRMTNSILRSNVYAIGNIQATGNADVELLYVTAFADSVACDAPTVTFTIRNSAVQFVDCAQATIDNSLVAEGAVGQGMGNVDFPLTLAELESIFEDPAGGELHLEETPPVWLLGIAVRGASDPPTDIDGDPRPRAGDDDYPGADVP